MQNIIWKNLTPALKLRLIFGLVLLVLITIFLYFKVVPGGHITYHRAWPRGLASGQGFIYDFKPGERLDISDPEILKMIGDPLYFSLFTPRPFDRAQVTVTYRDGLASTTPILEIGALKNKLTGSYELRPLENKILDDRREEWTVLEAAVGQTLVLQAEENYRSVADFFSDLDRGELRGCDNGLSACLAVYNYPFRSVYSLPDGEEISALEINQPLRGAHQFYVYLRPGDWQFDLTFVDLNLDQAADPITVSVSRETVPVVSRELSDKNLEPISGRSEDRSLSLPVIAESAGVYKVEIKVSDDIVILSLRSPSDRLVFINKIWPVSGSGGLRLYTDSSYLQVKTFNPASLGKIIFGDRTFAVDQTYKQFNFLSSGEIRLEKDDLILETNGVLAFNQEALFNPSVKGIDRFFVPNPDLKYILASYKPPFSSGEWKEATAELTLIDAHREDGRYTLLLSVPGLGAETPGSFLEIGQISVELTGRTLWQKIRSWISR